MIVSDDDLWSAVGDPIGRLLDQLLLDGGATATILSSVGATWDARLRRIKKIAEAIQSSQLPKREGTDHG